MCSEQIGSTFDREINYPADCNIRESTTPPLELASMENHKTADKLIVVTRRLDLFVILIKFMAGYVSIISHPVQVHGDKKGRRTLT